MAAYREGYDEIKVRFDPDANYDNPYKFFTSYAIDMKYGRKPIKFTPFEMIHEIMSRFIGLEIIEHHNDYCLIKDMSAPSSKEFDSSLRRVFLLLQQMGEETLEAINKNNPQVVKHTHDIDINLDKFHDFCVRVLNKKRFKDQREATLLFSTLYILELIGDEFKNISNHLICDFDHKNLKDLEQMCQLTVEQFNRFYDLFYNFTKEKAVVMSEKDIEIHFFLPRLYKKKPGKRSELCDEELEILNHFRRVSKYINAVTELRIEMEFCKH